MCLCPTVVKSGVDNIYVNQRKEVHGGRRPPPSSPLRSAALNSLWCNSLTYSFSAFPPSHLPFSSSSSFLTLHLLPYSLSLKHSPLLLSFLNFLSSLYTSSSLTLPCTLPFHIFPTFPFFSFPFFFPSLLSLFLAVFFI